MPEGKYRDHHPDLPTLCGHIWIEQIKQDLNQMNIRLDLNKPTKTITILCDLE